MDPLAEKYPAWSPYNYVMNNPLGMVDPDGRDTWFVHGTLFADYNQTDNRDQSLGRGYSAIHISSWQKALGDTGEGHFFDWSGGNNDNERRWAAAQLVASIQKEISKDPSKTINIVAHSHGGNVAMMAANALAKEGTKARILVMLGTPSREYKLNDQAKQNTQIKLNLYNQYDGVQTNGGNQNTWLGFEQGPAGRAHHGFDNRDVTLQSGLKPIKVPIYGREGNLRGYETKNPGIWDAHGAMHTNQKVMDFVHQYLVHRGLVK